MRKWLCSVCGWIYDEAEGEDVTPISAGTLWENLPEQWCCPECGAERTQFELVEVTG
jgi:rubredoxin-NAD+ reductase